GVQIGEVKYGKPILDRIIQRGTSLSDAAKCALISFDSTMRSYVSVGPPIDLLIYRRGSLKKDFTIRLEDDDPYLQAIRDGWEGRSTRPSTTSATIPAGPSSLPDHRRLRLGAETRVAAKRLEDGITTKGGTIVSLPCCLPVRRCSALG